MLFLNIEKDSKKKTLIAIQLQQLSQRATTIKSNQGKKQRKEKRKCLMNSNSYFLKIIKEDSKKLRKIYCYHSNYCYHREQQLTREELKERSKEMKKGNVG